MRFFTHLSINHDTPIRYLSQQTSDPNSYIPNFFEIKLSIHATTESLPERKLKLQNKKTIDEFR